MMLPEFVLYFQSFFCNGYGVRGSRFGHIFGGSKKAPKSAAIDQESLVSHFGIIKAPIEPSK